MIVRFRTVSLLMLVVVSTSLTRVQADEFVSLFNGKDLTGWLPVHVSDETFTVRDGMIVCSGTPKGFLRTDRQYENFILEFEWRHMESGGNSGLFVWGDGLPAVGAPYTRSIEVQMTETAYGKDRAGLNKRFTNHGDLFPIRGAVMKPAGRIAVSGRKSLPTELRCRPSPEWNTYRVECNNGTIRLSVNGKEVTVGEESIPRKGYICFESEESEIHFRNIRIKELPSTGVSPEMTASAYPGFVPLADGTGYAGWVVSDEIKEVWSVDGPMFAAKAKVSGKDRHLWTERNYRNFELIVDWRLPAEPAMRSRATFTPDGLYVFDEDGKQVRKDIIDSGDSGIFLRGHTQYQVNIWCQPMGSGDIQEIHKDPSLSAEIRKAMLPRIHADAPFGEWNRFIITLRGEYVTVELNGEKVIDNALLPGIPEEGPIGLQYHRDAVEFTNIFVRELP